jgi:hypothetical protein
VPFPTPEFTRKRERIGASCLEKLFWGKRYWLGAEDQAAEAEKRDDEQKLQRIDDVVSYLRGGYVEPEDKGHGEADKSGAADNWVNTDEKANGDAPGQLLRGCSETEKREDGQRYSPVEPVVAYGLGSWLDTCGDGFVVVHHGQDRLPSEGFVRVMWFLKER